MARSINYSYPEVKVNTVDGPLTIQFSNTQRQDGFYSFIY